ncbi:hypothetical protein LUI11_33505 [Bradyrhizobium diazoefficiens]|uniref:hypothetical protein n=1 Tax=Bradyrhizobium TaxID=374 RepID=UPI00045710E2|nr:hypothetical protein [Bradyrhizobium diazoefficiens]APO56893.1 hypothetical protein BD122_41405 [Bradyrhizobium diazoefficiens]MCD9296367.1 hypothetical protein [Bradyrhizobium diazoefficiens]MCD9814939.1 hypothetical protein [Bradyrhizobium diazoefficiens]MCD9833064.1 hypothetical protein [Bradyrhizobium diazoefficiens]MCD9851745.1 hypothetical protein [Bradyrhizobium diazoefficiens]
MLNNKIDINQELLRPNIMARCRAALIERYPLFRHVSQFSSLQSIRQTGIEPRIDKGPPDYVKARFGPSAGPIACWHPIGAELEPSGTKQPPFIRFVIRSSSLPEMVGPDWSYDDGLPTMLRESDPTITPEQIMLDFARRRGSIVAYSAVSPENLMVCAIGCDEIDPAKWPFLPDVLDEDIRKFEY